MTAYADTNFFTSLLVDAPRRVEADALAAMNRERGNEPLPVPRLLHLEVINALQRLVFEARHSAQKIRVTPEIALLAEDEFGDGLQAGDEWRKCEPDAALLLATFGDIVHRHTAERGFRTYDVVHVASAIVLGCDTFWSFDEKAKKLAALEGLKTN